MLASSASADARRPGPSAWRALVAPDAGPEAVPLALAVQLRQRSAGGARRWEARRVEAVTPRALARRSDDLLIGVRPMMRSASTGAWVKGDVSWDAVRRPGTVYRRDQARWCAQLYALARDTQSLSGYLDLGEWLTLDAVESALLWPHLEAGAVLGIPLLTGRKDQTVALASAAAVELAITPTSGGGLRLEPRVTIDDRVVAADTVRPLAGGGVYSFTPDRPTIALTLAPVPLDDAVRALLASPGGIVVPADERDEFLRDAYPRLARRVTLAPAKGLALPDPAPPVLAVSVRVRPGDICELAMTWVYPGLAPFAYARAADDTARDAAFESEVRDRVEQSWAEASGIPFGPQQTLQGADTAEFVTRVLPAFEALEGVRVDVRGPRRRYTELSGEPQIAVSTVESADADWFDLGVIVTIDDRVIPFTPLFTALSRGRKRMLLADGAFFSLAHPALDRLRELIDEAGELDEWETGPRISRYQTALWADFEDLADEALPAVSWRATAEGLRDVERIAPTPVPEAIRAELRPYQRAGLDWLAFLWQHRLGGILADDMGLGKTLQLLALVSHARAAGETRPFLVVAPTSVLSTWRAEAARFAPALRVQTIDATRATRGALAVDADIVVTSYTLLRLGEREFGAVEWAGLILDEAQFVKNPATKLHRVAKGLRADVVFAVTGTPLENSLSELWALLSLTAPGLFASRRRFREEYIAPIEHGKVPDNAEGGPYRAARLARLRRRIRPLVLRRTKELVAPELPPKQEQELRIELGPSHRALYDTVLQRERQKVLGLLDDLDRHRFIVFRSLTLLRMLSLDPGLVDPQHARVGSAKLDALLAHLAEVVAEGHRTLVFSQFTSFLQIAAARLDAAGIPYAYLDGATRKRGQLVEGFRAGETPVFLISLKAGGFGLTLTEADYVFMLDPWWNPAAEAQAIDRAHRIGQTRAVMIYRLIAADTIEEKVMALQQRKARLFHSVMDDDALFGQALDADDIRALLEG